MILWLKPAIAIHADGIMKASSPTAATMNSNRIAASISYKSKNTVLTQRRTKKPSFVIDCLWKQFKMSHEQVKWYNRFLMSALTLLKMLRHENVKAIFHFA